MKQKSKDEALCASFQFASVVIALANKEVDKVFYYAVPDVFAKKLTIGMRVLVPFGLGNKTMEGYVSDICAFEALPESLRLNNCKIKAIREILDVESVISSEFLELAKWMRLKYYTSLYACIKCIMPVGISYNNETSSVNNLELKQNCVFLNIDREDTDALLDDASPLSEKQKAVIYMLLEEEGILLSELKSVLKISDSPIKTLENKGVLKIEPVRILRDTVAVGSEVLRNPPVLTKDQEEALNMIKSRSDNRPILINGVTGSGKTEVYLKIIEDVLNKGKDAIVLVPEIALTPQTVSIFISRFGELVSVTHSRQSLGERYDQWKKAKDGLIKIMIGPRSAVFTPFNNLGVIIIDEEHEHTYKSETNPKYCTKEVAIKRCELENSFVILGSATPSVESYYSAKRGDFTLINMVKRINDKFPEIQIADMRFELAEGNKSIFSMALRESLEEAVKNGKQAILFLNRRGFSTFVSCRKCGYVMMCDDCNVNYTYHKYSNELICHYCSKNAKNPENCPACGSRYIKYFGVGTQRIEEELNEYFPGVSFLRMDMDTTSGKNSHDKILSAFRAGEAQILVGTQMIAKGLDFPNVTLVGVVAADISIHSGDFRSAEVTMQLLTQVAGRAGRGDTQGKVILQTYMPEHYSIEYVKSGSYEAFYEHEIALRRQMNYPPFTKVFSVLASSEDEKKLIAFMFKLQSMMKYCNRKGLFEVLGPSPAMIVKIKKKYRYKIIVKSEDEEKLKSFIFFCIDKLKETEDVGDIAFNLTLNPTYIT